MALEDPALADLVGYIKDSFRVRQNQRPVYVDVGDNLRRIRAAQHQVVFGRRGSGKSCLFVHVYQGKKQAKRTAYILADEFKRLSYPDVLIRLVLAIMEQVPVQGRWWKKLLRRPIAVEAHAKELRALLDLADESDVTQSNHATQAQRADASVGDGKVVKAGYSAETTSSQGQSSAFKERKIDVLERHLRDYKDALVEAINPQGAQYGIILLDDFYLLPRSRQPDIIDYLHRLVRDTNIFLKVATIKHRTSLLRNDDSTIGIELSQDMEELTLDRTLESLDGTRQFLHAMLAKMGENVGVSHIDEYFNPDAFEALVLVSGGVPRDALTIFVNAVEAARASGSRWITPTAVYKGAGRLAYTTKLKNLKEDAGIDVDGLERVFVDLLSFCLRESKKTAFLISQDEAQSRGREHEIIQQLMDLKLIHVVEPDTSAASGRPGRYEAYTLDFSLFMEPRRRGIEIVEFWKTDDQRRRMGIREAPVYSLDRVAKTFDDANATDDAEAILQATEEAHSEASPGQPRLAPPQRQLELD